MVAPTIVMLFAHHFSVTISRRGAVVSVGQVGYLNFTEQRDQFLLFDRVLDTPYPLFDDLFGTVFRDKLKVIGFFQSAERHNRLSHRFANTPGKSGWTRRRRLFGSGSANPLCRYECFRVFRTKPFFVLFNANFADHASFAHARPLPN